MKSLETQNSLGESDTLCSNAILIPSEVDQRRESCLSVNVRSSGDSNAEELRRGCHLTQTRTDAGTGKN